MKKIGVEFGENGKFVGDFLEGMDLPEGHVLHTGEVPNGLYRPVLVDGEVVEGATQEEIDAITAPDPSALPSAEERIEALEAALTMLMGV